jgi:acetyl esterase/lipase
LFAAVLITSPLALGACNDDPAGVQIVGDRYVDEIFGVAAETDVPYGSATDENGAEEILLLDLFQPEGDDAPSRPAVVWLHGGSFQHGHKGETGELARSAARRGFVSVSANYRLRENADFDYTKMDDPIGEQAKHDAQHDAKAAVRWLRANAQDLRIDTNRIFLAGYSAGGTAALRVAASPDDEGSSGNPGHSSSVKGVVAVSTKVEPGRLDAANGPTLLIHGTDDTKVPFAEVEEACAQVAGCELTPVQGGVHHMINTARDQILSESMRFLRDQVTP